MGGDGFSRRAVLTGAGQTAVAGAVALALADRSLATTVRASDVQEHAGTRAAAADRSPDAIFPQSVASGGPTPTGVILWTRVAADAHASGEPLFLDVATNESFDDATRYRIPAAELGADADYTVRVDLAGELAPDRRYFYRFEYARTRSRVGRCHTLPAPDASPERVRFAVLSCQDFRNGYYGTYRHVADADVDFLVHLGDFIYETAGPSEYDGRDLALPSGAGVAMGLPDYRYLHRTYRGDPALQAALRRHTLVATWDDHEIVNNGYWDYEADRPATNDHPRADDPAFMTSLFADAIQAWWEYLPTRTTYDPEATHLHDRLRLWRSVRFGDLLELLVTDERLFRSEPPGFGGTTQVSFSEGVPDPDPDRTMLGASQREWFTDRLAAAETDWTAWANEVLNTSLRLSVDDETLYNADAWDGYEHERRLLMAALGESPVSRFVALTGDMHTALAGYLQERYPADEDGATYPNDETRGVEFMVPAVTSINLAEFLDLPGGPVTERMVEDLVREENPHVEFFNSHRWGYAEVEFTREACTYTAYAVPKDVAPEDASRTVLRRLEVPVDADEIRDVTGRGGADGTDGGGGKNDGDDGGRGSDGDSGGRESDGAGRDGGESGSDEGTGEGAKRGGESEAGDGGDSSGSRGEDGTGDGRGG